MDPAQKPILPVMPTPEPSVAQSPPPGNKPSVNRLRLVIIGAIVLLLVVGIPVSAMFLGKKALEPVQKMVVATPTPTPDPTANWKTYMNLSYGYKIKLPPDWNAYSSDPNIYDKCEENSINNVRVELTRTKLKECAGPDSAMSANTEISIIYFETENNVSKETYTEAKEIIFAGERALKDAFTERSELPREQATIIWVNHNGKGYMISLRQTDKVGTYDKVYDQILSTFKFLDQSVVDTADWKSYKGDNFSFKYPSDLKVENKTELGNSLIYGHQVEPYVEFSLEIFNMSPEEVVKNEIEQKGSIQRSETLTVNGLQAAKYIGQRGIAGSVYFEDVVFSKNNLTYYFSLGTYDEKELLDQILSTFRFD